MKHYLFVCVSLFVFVLASCTSDEVEVMRDADGMYVYNVELEGEVTGYDATTRAAKTWQIGDVLYLRFLNSSGSLLALSTAKYNGSSWTLNSNYALVGSGSCWTTQIVNPAGEATDTSVPLSAQSAVYQAKDGTWSQSGNTLHVSVHLKPLLGRMRFKGYSGTPFNLSGLSTYTAFMPSDGTFTSSTNAVTASILASGYSPYFYGSFADSSSPSLTIGDYTLACNSDMMQAGTSGWLNYPTASNHTGWTTPGGGSTPSADDYEYVDLGLSVKWATCNVGAVSPEDYGDYFAWGETTGYMEGKTNFYWSTYKWCKGTEKTMTKYCTDYSYGTVDNKTVLDPEDDVAHVKWGGSWRMPTIEECDELINNCTWTWTTQNGVTGYIVTSKTNGNSIFLPAAGYRSVSNFYNAGSDGRYLSSSLHNTSRSGSGDAYELHYNSGSVYTTYSSRCIGRSVRPVCP